MDSTLLAIFAAFVAGVVFGYMVREGISRRRRARERHRFHYDNEAYGDATLVPGWHGELQNTAGRQDAPTRRSFSRTNGEDDPSRA
jgi:hypothetical protein